MNNLVINKNNFWKILDEFYLIISNNKNIVLEYKLEDTNQTSDANIFLKKIKSSPIKSNLNPLTFQQNERSKW